MIFDGSLKICTLVVNNAKDHLACWYKAQALEYITQRVEHYSQLTGLKYKSVRINNATSRWGSCSFRNTLNFTWRLIMAPSKVIDYVVMHELIHLKQRDHSRKYWNEVAHIMPDYRQDERWLKLNGHLLAWS